MKRLSFAQEPEVDSAVVAQEVMLLLARSGVVVGAGAAALARPQASFECKTCNRQFPSFQALGGHRASHKRPRGGGGAGEANSPAPATARRHGCAVCGVEFALGQALGGHMRRHRAAGAEADEEEPARGPLGERKPGEARGLQGLDLNATPSEDSTCLGPLGLTQELVDCPQ